MYRTFVRLSNATALQYPGYGYIARDGGYYYAFATLEEAKKSVETLVTAQPIYKNSGFTAYILDENSGQIVEHTNLPAPLPALTWYKTECFKR